MSLETNRINEAKLNSSTVDAVKEVFRNALLSALSEARSLTLTMEPRYRDALLDGLTKEFHPDGNCTDLFSDAFHDVENMIERDIEILADELALGSRQAAE